MTGPLTDQQLDEIAAHVPNCRYGCEACETFPALVDEIRRLRGELAEMTHCRDNAIRAAERADQPIEFDLDQELRDGLEGIAEWPDGTDLAPDWLINAVARIVRPELARLTEQRDHLVSAFDKLSDQMGELVQAAQGERGRYVAENQRLREEADRLRAAWESAWAQRNETRDLLHRFAGHEDTPCRFDHHGDRQEHGSSGPCPVAQARRVLGLDGAEEAPQTPQQTGSEP